MLTTCIVYSDWIDFTRAAVAFENPKIDGKSAGQARFCVRVRREERVRRNRSVFRAGATPDVTVARDLEVLAYHMLYTKPWIGRKYAVAPALRDCEAFALWKSETSREHHLECVDAPR